MANYEDLNTPKIAVVGFLGAIIVFAAVILLQAMFYHVQARQEQEKVTDQPSVEYANLTASQQNKLAEYRWVDEKEKIVGIPIERAKEIVLAELQKGTWKPENPPTAPAAEKEKGGADGK
jgi:hypothetical protein